MGFVENPEVAQTPPLTPRGGEGLKKKQKKKKKKTEKPP